MSKPNFMLRAIELSREGLQPNQGGPFGAVVVKEGKIIGSGTNRVLCDNDPTAHAEIVAIRQACQALGNFCLQGCDLYTSCEPCPMCLGAIHWSRLDRIHYAGTRSDAAAIGFDDESFYYELSLPPSDRRIPMQQMLRDEALRVMQEWQSMADKKIY